MSIIELNIYSVYTLSYFHPKRIRFKISELRSDKSAKLFVSQDILARCVPEMKCILRYFDESTCGWHDNPSSTTMIPVGGSGTDDDVYVVRIFIEEKEKTPAPHVQTYGEMIQRIRLAEKLIEEEKLSTRNACRKIGFSLSSYRCWKLIEDKAKIRSIDLSSLPYRDMKFSAARLPWNQM